MELLITIGVVILALIIVFALLRFLFKLAWHLLAAGCVVLLIVAVGVVIASYLMK